MPLPVAEVTTVPADGTTQAWVSGVAPGSDIKVHFIGDEGERIEVLSETVPDDEVRLTFDTVGEYTLSVSVIMGSEPGFWKADIDAI